MPATEIQNVPGITSNLAPYLADFERFQRELPPADTEPAFVQSLRRRGLERFMALGFPSNKQEEWRLTNVAPIAHGTFHRAGSDPNAVEPEQIAAFDFPAAARLVFVDGR